MSNSRPFLLAIPAFLVGGFATATIVSSARAQMIPHYRLKDVPLQPAPKPHWEYKVVGSENDLNRFAGMGWEYVGQSSAASATPNMQTSFTTYTMKRFVIPPVIANLKGQ